MSKNTMTRDELRKKLFHPDGRAATIGEIIRALCLDGTEEETERKVAAAQALDLADYKPPADESLSLVRTMASELSGIVETKDVWTPRVLLLCVDGLRAAVLEHVRDPDAQARFDKFRSERSAYTEAGQYRALADAIDVLSGQTGAEQFRQVQDAPAP